MVKNNIFQLNLFGSLVILVDLVFDRTPNTVKQVFFMNTYLIFSNKSFKRFKIVS